MNLYYFEKFILKHIPCFKINRDKISFCYSTKCNKCIIRDDCKKFEFIYRGYISFSEFKVIKEKYPEFFI